MVRRHRFLAILSVLAFVAGTNVWLAGPAGAACSTGLYRAGDKANGVSNAKGVQAVLQMPYSGEVYGMSSSRGPSDGDVFLSNGNDFVQLGWNIGATTNIAYHSNIKVFWGEYWPGVTNSEKLHSGAVLSLASYHTFTISFSSQTGYYEFYVDGQYVGETGRAHFAQGNAAFTGETDNTCVGMSARAIRSTAPTRTLKYLTFGTSGSVWHYFSDSRYANTAGFYSVDGGDIATDYAYH